MRIEERLKKTRAAASVKASMRKRNETIVDISTILSTMYLHVTVVMLAYDWWQCMVINIRVQYNGGLLPDIILLTQG